MCIRYRVNSSIRVGAAVRGLAMSATTWWGLYRTRRILSGLDERARKDIGFPATPGPGAAVDPWVLRRLDTLR